jgi:hypothetical protein
MKVLLTPEESESIFYDALCNSLAYIESGYDLNLTYFTGHYEQAVKTLRGGQNGAPQFPDTAICYEDVLMQILRQGHQLNLMNIEEDASKSITLQDVHERVQEAPMRHLMDAINETGDAITGDVIIQQVFFQEVIFG